MRLDKFISELTSHQKQDENPTILDELGNEAISVEYISEGNAMIIYFNEYNEDAPVEMEFKGLDLPDDTIQLETL